MYNTSKPSFMLIFCRRLVQFGESAVELAYVYHHDDIVEYLMSSGDKVTPVPSITYVSFLSNLLIVYL